MNKKLNHYVYDFNKHVLDFCLESGLKIQERPLLISLSGGVDSVALTEVLFQLYKAGELKYKPRCLHFNHGTRKQCIAEEEFVRSFTAKRSLELKVIHLNFDSTRNFENTARKLRYKYLKDSAKENELIVLGHHIDDSFEWHLMQKLKSSQLTSSLGIPLVNGRIRRPFMCVTKEQIYKYAKASKLKWFEDQSNDSLKFERNYIRKHIINLKEKYPKYLKHYVHQANELAQTLSLNVKKKNENQITIIERNWGFVIKGDLCGLGQSKNFLKALYQLSNKNRGKVKAQLLKLDKAILNNKTGPISFSGGVHFLNFGQVSLLYRNIDKVMLLDLQIPGAVPFLKKSSKKNSRRLLNKFFRDYLSDGNYEVSNQTSFSHTVFWL